MAHFNDLNDYCLLSVLDLLSPNQLVKMQRVNRRLNRVTVEKMRTKIKAISFIESNRVFSDCTHLDPTARDKVLVLKPTIKDHFLQILFKTYHNFQEPSEKAIFFGLLNKCSGVKSIDFGYFQLPGDVLLEVVERCPEIECIKLVESVVKEDEWEQIGNKIVHFVKYCYLTDKTDGRLLNIIAAKCPNIKQVKWRAVMTLPSDLLTTFKLLPKSCWITLDCESLLFPSSEIFEDVVDELSVSKLNWSSLVPRYDRLSSLKVKEKISLIPFSPNRVVEFAGLKKLDVSAIRDNDELIAFVDVIQLPQLEDLRFSISILQHCFSQDGYDRLFQKMTSLKKLIIFWDMRSEYCSVSPELPRTAILQLKNLETIDIKILNFKRNWNTKSFFWHLVQYVKNIRSLKKLTVEVKCRLTSSKRELEQMISILKLKQSRVEVDLIYKKK